MVLLGGFVYSPICTGWVVFLNPWYLSKIRYYYPPFKHVGKWTEIATAVSIDKLILTWPYLAVMLFAGGLIHSRGDMGHAW